MLRSTPCGRGGLRWGSSPLAMRSVQSPKYLNGARAEAACERVEHVLAGLARLDAAHPRLLRSVELAERIRHPGIVRVESWPS